MKIKTPISFTFTYNIYNIYNDYEWKCVWKGLIFRLCCASLRQYVSTKNPCTLTLRKSPCEGFTKVRLWVEHPDTLHPFWRHDQPTIFDNQVFLRCGIDKFLTILSEGKTEMFLYFKFTQ